MSTRHHFVVTADLAGSRLDRYLASQHPHWSRSRARRLIDQDRVRHNGRPARPATLVREGDTLDVDEPPPQSVDVTPQEIPLDIIAEDPDILVLNKPADLVIHPAAGNPDGTLVNALLHHCRDLSGIGGYERPGIVHRLDKGTTGVMVVAKSDRAHLRLALAFRRREIHKAYLAVCYGIPSPGEGAIDAAIARHPHDRQRMSICAGGRPARTLYAVAERHASTSLVRCQPITGRTHQIRVHLTHLGHALVGDPTYAGRQWRGVTDSVAAAACRNFPRQALHAWRLQFNHPVSGEPLSFEAPLPPDMIELLAVLRGDGKPAP